MLDFMMPVQPGMPGELPPGIPPAAIPTPVPQVPVPQMQPLPALPTPPQQAPAPEAPQLAPEIAQNVLQEEGAEAPSQTGTGFFDKLRTDPKMSQAMLMMGLRMMQGNKPGQDGLGMMGDAMMAAATAHNMLSYNEKQQQMKEKEFGLKERESNARTAELVQNTSQKAALFPETQEKLRQEVSNLRAQGRKEEAAALAQEFKSDPQRLAEAWDLDLSVKSANINQSNAAAGASSASARASNALTGDREQAAQMRKWAVEGTPEQQKQARAYFTVDDPTSRAANAKQDQVQALIRQVNPKATDQEVAAQTLEFLGSAKGERITALKSIIDNGSDAQREAALAEMETLVLGKKRPVGGQAPAPQDMSSWERVNGYALKPGANRELKSSWVKVQ